MTSTFAVRYRQLTEQEAYRRRVTAFGLRALLAPYSLNASPALIAGARVPEQRRPA